MRHGAFVLAGALWAVAAGARVRADDDVPAPRFDGGDHAHPEACLALDPHAGDPAAIRVLAATLRRASPTETLAAVDRFMARSMVWDAEAFDDWRTVETMLSDGTFGGCADHAMAYGTLLRACGIPTLWVKSMDLAWVERLRAGRFDPSRDAWSGHVFLEVHLDGAWRLLDAQAREVYRTYDVQGRRLPGERYAYDKGGSPWELVLSVRWEPWKRQTATFFAAHDPAPHLSGAGAGPAAADAVPASPRVFVTGNSPQWRWAHAAATEAGAQIGMTFNAEFERWLAAARGHELLVTCSKGEPVLPAALRAEWLPLGWERTLARTGPDAGRPTERRLADGTRVVLVPASDHDGLVRAVREALTR